MTRRDVSEAAGVSPGLITNYFKTIESLRQEVVRAAVAAGNAAVIAQALVNRDPIVLDAPEEIKRLGVEFLSNS